jgi:hypothetical protein
MCCEGTQFILGGEVEKLSIQLEAGGSDPESLTNNMIEVE